MNPDIRLASIGGPSNTTSETVSLTGVGTIEVVLSEPLVVDPEEEFSVMLCPVSTAWGTLGEDESTFSSGRSYWSPSACGPSNFESTKDFMIRV